MPFDFGACVLKETINAVYENGVFRPLKTPRIPSGKHVVLEIDVPEEGSPEEILQLATHVYEGLSDSDIDEVEAIAFDRSNFFSNREGEWPNE